MLATCPRCGTRVMPMPDGRCPACKRPWSGDPVEAGPAEETAAATGTPKRKGLRREHIRALCGVAAVLGSVSIMREDSHGLVLLFDLGVVILAGIGILLTYVWPRRAEKEGGRTT